jgi:hypothetical protein
MRARLAYSAAFRIEAASYIAMIRFFDKDKTFSHRLQGVLTVPGRQQNCEFRMEFSQVRARSSPLIPPGITMFDITVSIVGSRSNFAKADLPSDTLRT